MRTSSDRRTIRSLLLALIAGAVLAPDARAVTHALTSLYVSEALSESVPSADAPTTSWSAADFALEPFGATPPGIQVSFAERTLEWVRVSELLVIPRARILLKTGTITAGQIENAGFIQPLVIDPRTGEGTAELPVALISGEKNAIRLRIARGSETVQAEWRIRFKPRKPAAEPAVFIDSTCSRHRVRAEKFENWRGTWAYVGCRQVYTEGANYSVPSFELFVFWDGVGQAIQVDGMETAAPVPSVWPMRLRSRPGRVRLGSAQGSFELGYSVPERLHKGSLSAGLGPYAYHFDAPGNQVSTLAPLLTLYGSYFITETDRIIAFDATAFNSNFYSDLGVYFYSQSIRALDNRFTMNVMLGGHAIAFKALGATQVKFGVPQGIELGYRDAFKRGYNLTVGSFIYPLIDNKSYYNLWLRWGTGALFGELNYIGWHEPVESSRVYSRSVGITVGFPLARFL